MLLFCKPRKGISFADIETTYERVATSEVVGFDSLTVDGRAVGRQMLQELLRSSAGMVDVLNNTRYPARKIAAEIRNEDAHAVLWHPTKMEYYLASEFHKEAAQTLVKPVSHNRAHKGDTAASVVQKCSREQWWSLFLVAMPPQKK